MKSARTFSVLPSRSRIARRSVLFAIVAGCLWSSSRSEAESLWNRRDQRSAFLFADTRARRVGDLLTVQIQEVTGIDEQDDVQLSKATSANGNFNVAASSDSNGLARETEAAFSANQGSNRTFAGASAFESDRSFIDQITVNVVDILPNRNLVIEGARTRMISGEKRVMRVSGVVRPDDIELGNLVFSRSIADFQIKYEGEGHQTQYTRHGWLGKVVTKLWPF